MPSFNGKIEQLFIDIDRKKYSLNIIKRLRVAILQGVSGRMK
ncbi:hypothetical protein FM107_08795 [Sphingobacterium sp. JB170]|nr:hypothetical protein FM107_08795 [Sphingobacterium sp. JB170]